MSVTAVKPSKMPIILGSLASILCLSAGGIFLLNSDDSDPSANIHKEKWRKPHKILSLPQRTKQYPTDNTVKREPYKPELPPKLNKSLQDNKAALEPVATLDSFDSTPVVKQPPLPLLAASDKAFQRDLLAVSPALKFMFVEPQTIRLVMSILNDISQGLRPPLKLLRKFNLLGEFKVKKVGKKFYMNAQSYHRYDRLAQAIKSIDTQKAVRLYQKYQPLLAQVFGEYSYPKIYTVLDIVQGAAAKILRIPVIESEIELLHPTVRYRFADPKLESLSALEKQMLRMGAENTRIIQAKLRELIQALVAAN